MSTRFVDGTFTDKLSIARHISETALQDNGGWSDPLGGHIGGGAVLCFCSFSWNMGKQRFETLLRFKLFPNLLHDHFTPFSHFVVHLAQGADHYTRLLSGGKGNVMVPVSIEHALSTLIHFNTIIKYAYNYVQ